jgi:hypothetical protein
MRIRIRIKMSRIPNTANKTCPKPLSDSLWTQVKVRVSLSGEDVRLLLSSTDTVLQAKLKLQVYETLHT